MSAQGHNRLPSLAADIRAAHLDVQKSAEATAKRALDAGRLLIEAKAEVAHGSWEAWIAANTGLSARSARRYMQLADAGMETATVADLGVRAAAEAIARKRPPAFDADDSGGWPMPEADECLLIQGPRMTGATIEPARGLPENGPRFYDFAAITDWETGAGVYGRKPMRAAGVKLTLAHEGFCLSQCSCLTFRMDTSSGRYQSPSQFRNLFLQHGDMDREAWRTVPADLALAGVQS